MTLPKVLRTKIMPPPKSARTLSRPRVSQALLEALHYRLTILQAGAGYGKSTALTVLAEETPSLLWYQVSEEDADPLVFLLHLCHASQRALPELSGLPVPFLEAWDGTRGPLPSAGVVDQVLNALSDQLEHPVLLVLDDAHLAASAFEIALILDRLIGKAPHNLHILLACRPPLKLPNLSRWRAQGEVLTLDQSVLAFNAAEISALFSQHYKVELAPDEVDTLLANTEGWAIALQLIWQSLRSGSFALVENSLVQRVDSLESLFEILAREVFEDQPPDVREFLLVSATLREMTAEACDELRTAPGHAVHDSAAMLAYLRRQELFVVDLGDGSLRFHHIFHTFLRRQASAEQRQDWHRRAAAGYHSRQDLDSSIYHLLRAEDYQGAASLLDEYGAQLLAAGRLDTLANHLDVLPPEILRQHPALLFFLGDLARLHSRFEEALGWYRQAESAWRERGQVEGVGRALRGQARVYLDTVNPSRAEELLQQATRLSDGFEDRESQARLYELLAENKLNAGRVEQAEELRLQAEALRSEGPSDSQLIFRVYLRTGRLEEARRGLEAQAEAERREPVQTPRAHRETLLLLALIYTLQGRAVEAFQAAQEGTRRGIDLQSPFITAVGHMRQGHSLMLIPGPERYAQARQQYEKSIELSRTLSVSRLRVEACWGLCRSFGYQGDLVQAMQAAQEGIEIASQAGDEWIASLLRLSMGASLTLWARFEAAEEWLNRAAIGFQECSDPFGLTAARLWLCLGWLKQKETHEKSGQKTAGPGRPAETSMRLAQTLPEVLAACRQAGYDFLLTRPSLLGPPDERVLVPLLILARQQGWESGYVSRLLSEMGLAEVAFHPGYQLRVFTLGSFQAWRGDQPVPAGSWRREKARQLYQLLITHRSSPLDRDQINEYLWPELDPSAAQRNFKVTLNTLYQALEPEREPGKESAFILREGSIYGLRPEADLWLDVEAFSNLIRQADALLEQQPARAMQMLQEAVDLYQGEYLPEARYETWAAAEREHLAVLFLRTADRLAVLLIQQGRCEEAVHLCQRILATDNCWERAYRLLMLAFDRLGDHGQVARTYRRCVQALKDELDVPPAPETEALFQKLIKSDA